MSHSYCYYTRIIGGLPRGIFRYELLTSQDSRTMKKKKKKSQEQDQRGCLRHDECDGRIITVGHKDQVSSSCITLTLLTPLSQSVNVPNSDVLQVENKPTQLASSQLPNRFVFQSRHPSVRDWNTSRSGASSRYISCYLDQNAGVWTATGPRTVTPRRRRI